MKSNMESHKIVGYVLLIIGLILAIIAPVFAVSILFKGSSAIPKMLATPVLSNSTSDLSTIVNAAFPAVNVIMLFIISVILIYAGGVIMSRGVNLIKEIKLKAVRDTVKEVSGEVEVKKEKANKPEKSPTG